jgi:hypothetical protein
VQHKELGPGNSARTVDGFSTLITSESGERLFVGKNSTSFRARSSSNAGSFREDGCQIRKGETTRRDTNKRVQCNNTELLPAAFAPTQTRNC